MKRIKLLIIFLCLTVMTVFTGAKKKSVELLDKALLIDLDKTIKKTDFGTGGNNTIKEEKKSEKKSVSENKAKESIQTEGESNTTGGEGGRTAIVISVHETTIKMDGENVPDVNEIKTLIVEKYPTGVFITLNDDFAKASTFNEIIAILDQLREPDKYDYIIN